MPANQPVTIYISAANDLMAERDTLAQMIAKLPVTLAWQVIQTPVGEDMFQPELVAEADLHFLVMGTDIRAPVGLELYAARQRGRSPMAFLKRRAARTTAGQVFINDSRLAWRPFTDAANLAQQVQQILIGHLLRHATRYSLTVTEVESLEALQAAEPSTQAAAEGTGRSAVILSRERYEPSEGVVVGDEDA